jgi:hypothetical protein
LLGKRTQMVGLAFPFPTRSQHFRTLSQINDTIVPSPFFFFFFQNLYCETAMCRIMSLHRLIRIIELNEQKLLLLFA